ncbi:hypothetical protein KKC52_02540 [bacterium]|nr:hypothetical protein [bacterium]
MAVGIPTIVIFGPTNPRKWGPINTQKHLVVKKDLSCSPCHKHRCKKEPEHACMSLINVEDVLEAVTRCSSFFIRFPSFLGIGCANPLI